jgi:hypothetical protein
MKTVFEIKATMASHDFKIIRDLENFLNERVPITHCVGISYEERVAMPLRFNCSSATLTLLPVDGFFVHKEFKTIRRLPKSYQICNGDFWNEPVDIPRKPKWEFWNYDNLVNARACTGGLKFVRELGFSGKELADNVSYRSLSWFIWALERGFPYTLGQVIYADAVIHNSNILGNIEDIIRLAQRLSVDGKGYINRYIQKQLRDAVSAATSAKEN